MKNRKAFTLLEVLIAVTFITVVFTAITGLILMTMQTHRKNLHSLQATYLAQEGLEAMRYIRDSNWLQNYAWDMGGDQWGVDYGVFDESAEYYLIPKLETGRYWGLQSVDSQVDDEEVPGTIQLESGPEFTRVIRVENIPDEVEPTLPREDALRVTAVVSWEDRGRDQQVEVSTILTNWQ